MNNSQLAHTWAHQLKEKCSGSNFYYRGRTIYSYGPHFPIATILDNGKVLFTSKSYSNTTAKHKSHVLSAIFQEYFTIPSIADNPGEINHLENMDYYISEIKDTLEKAIRSHIHTEALQEKAVSLVDEMQIYINDFKNYFVLEVPEEAQRLIKLKEDGALFSEKEQAKIKEKIKTQKEAKKAKELRRQKEALKAVKTWQNGGENIPWHLKNDLAHEFLRVKKNRLETSRGSVVPFQLAKSVYKRMIEGENVEGVTIAGFKVSKVYNDYVIIGCHTIQKEEMKRVFNL